MSCVEREREGRRERGERERERERERESDRAHSTHELLMRQIENNVLQSNKVKEELGSSPW